MKRNQHLGTVTLPAIVQDNTNISHMNNFRQAMQQRIAQVFDNFELILLEQIDGDADMKEFINLPPDDSTEFRKVRQNGKPVVLGDAIPVPSNTTDNIIQLLEAAIAHHNLGSYDESIKFFEAARVEISELEKVALRRRNRKIGISEKSLAQGSASSMESSVFAELSASSAIDQNDVELPIALDIYISFCKGNVYQSSGDDEEALRMYMNGYSRARRHGDKHWEGITLNAVGLLAYFHMRYDVALLAFSIVSSFREEVIF
jgi:tetratricopeptide (TPR) repeat protein